MPLDQVVFPDVPELYYAAVRALHYCDTSSEHSSEQSAGMLHDACCTTFSPGKPRKRHGSFSNWLHRWFSHLVGSADGDAKAKADRPALYRHSYRFLGPRDMTPRLKKQKTLPEATEMLIQNLRKDLAMLVIETEALIAVLVERAKVRTGQAAELRENGRGPQGNHLV